MAKVFKSVHEILNDSMLMLVLLHVLASLKHHFLDRDTVLRRMFVWRRS
jgi:cytochrome b561